MQIASASGILRTFADGSIRESKAHNFREALMRTFKLIAAACGLTLALSGCVVNWLKEPTESDWLIDRTTLKMPKSSTSSAQSR